MHWLTWLTDWITNQLHAAETFLSSLFLGWQNSPCSHVLWNFYDSLPQELATCTCPKTDQFGPCPNSSSWRFILILYSHPMPKSPKHLFPAHFPTKELHVCPTLLLPHTCHMPQSSHSSWFNHLNNVWWAVEIIKLIMQPPPRPPDFLLTVNNTFKHNLIFFKHVLIEKPAMMTTHLQFIGLSDTIAYATLATLLSGVHKFIDWHNTSISLDYR